MKKIIWFIYKLVLVRFFFYVYNERFDVSSNCTCYRTFITNDQRDKYNKKSIRHFGSWKRLMMAMDLGTRWNTCTGKRIGVSRDRCKPSRRVERYKTKQIVTQISDGPSSQKTFSCQNVLRVTDRRSPPEKYTHTTVNKYFIQMIIFSTSYNSRSTYLNATYTRAS